MYVLNITSFSGLLRHNVHVKIYEINLFHYFFVWFVTLLIPLYRQTLLQGGYSYEFQLAFTLQVVIIYKSNIITTQFTLR